MTDVFSPQRWRRVLLRDVWRARKGTQQYRTLLIEGVVNHTLSIDRCAWASSIRWWWGGRQVLLKLRCLRRRVCCLSLSPWWSGWKAAGCLNAVRSHLRFRVGLDMYELTTGEYTVVFKLYILSCQLALILSTKRMSPFNLGSNYRRTFREQCVTVTNDNDINYAAKGIH